MQEFSILKACNVSVKPPRAPIIREVVWTPPISPRIKINTDGACVKNPVKASTGGIFRNNEGCCVGCFAQSLGDGNALVAELSAVITAVELAASKGYWNVWLESDSQLVLQAFKSNMIIPWSLINRWYNCLVITHSMRFFCFSYL